MGQRKVSWEAVIGSAALLALVLLAFAREQQHAAQPDLSTPSTFDYGLFGYTALYDLLRRENVSVSRFERAHALLSDATTTLVVAQTPSDILAGHSGFSRNDVVGLKDWVSGGGRLILLSPPYGDAGDTMLGIPASRERQRAVTNATPFANLAVTAAIRSVRGDFRTQFDDAATPKALPLLVTRDGIVALQYRLGRGKIVVLTDPSVFANERLDQADNARFALNLLGGSDAVAFDESIHGYVRGDSLWNVLPAGAHLAVYVVGVAVLLALVGSLFRFAPPIPLEEADERDSSAYITSMAQLLARGRAARKALRDGADFALRAVRHSLGVSERTPIGRVATRVERPELRMQILELDRLRDLESPTDAELMRAGWLCVRLRKEFNE